MGPYWYRFEEQSYSVGNEDGDHDYSVQRLHLRKLKILRETPCGVQLVGLSHGPSNPRFVNRSWGKRWACPTIEEAAESFRARKKRQIAIFSARIQSAENALRLLDVGQITEGIDW